MHELSVMMEVVKTVEEEARKNNVTKIKTLTLQVGEISSVVPEYIKDCYEAAFKQTMLEGAALEIEVIHAEAKCAECGNVFNIKKTKAICPFCGSREAGLITGREFMIKEASGE